MSFIILPIVLVIIGAIGVVGTIWVSASFKARETTIPQGSEWFSISPEIVESEISMRLREKFRNLLKQVLIWMIAWYRKVSKEITIKQTLKKQVRTFLYDHTPEGVRHPSEFWHRVRHTDKKHHPKANSDSEAPIEKEE